MMKKLLAATAVLAAVLAVGQAQAGDAANGEKVFKKQCKKCHKISDDMKKAVGPNLYGVVGRAAGSVDGFKYSSAMTDSGLTWDAETIDKYLADPKGFVPKNKMAFKGLKEESDRADVIAYIEAESAK